jgi:ABC-type Mn2+/Zn2+ transport system permease subunit
LAKSQNISVGKYNLVYLLLIALGVKVVGGLLTAAIVAIPAAASRNMAKNLAQYKFLSSSFGVLGSAAGGSHFASDIVAGWTINHGF